MLQSEAGYIDARPHIRQLDQSSFATHGRTIHSGHKRKGSERANVVRFSPQSGHRELASVCPFSARMYGPAVRYKMDFQDNERESCINVSGL